MVNSTRKEIIQGFMRKAKEEVTGLNAGFEQGFKSAIGLAWCWISFEAFTSAKYNEDFAGERINQFCDDFEGDYLQEFDSMPTEFIKNMIGLKQYNVPDMRPSHLTDPTIRITDEKNLRKVFEVVYRVRNNLFHGGKDMNEEKDMNLVRYSSVVLYYILEKFLGKEGLI